MNLSLFINFDGECKEAVEFYARVFKSEVFGMMTFDMAPPHPDYPVPEEDKDKVMFASVNIAGTNVMFSDTPRGMSLIKGNNISPTVVSNSKEDIRDFFNGLKEDGIIEMDLGQTFWSELYGMVTDKYGITWQLSYDDGKMNLHGE